MRLSNGKEYIINYENSIKKSNEFSMAKLNYKLSLNQMQLLAFSIYCTQKDGKTEFRKVDFEKMFNLNEYRREEAKQDVAKLFDLRFSVDDVESDEFDFLHVFQRINYKRGLFVFKWSEDMLPHILEMKDKYIVTDLTVTSKFKSSFSWILYDYLKAHFNYFHKPISKSSLMALFGTGDVKTYQSNTGKFKQSVLDVAIAEINEHTELEVWYKEEKQGRAIVGFDIYWTSGKTVVSATKKQIKELKTIVEAVLGDGFKYINLKHDGNRQRANDLVEEFKDFLEFTSEPICIKRESADLLIKIAKSHMRELEQMLQYEREQPKSTFYNWLDERE